MKSFVVGICVALVIAGGLWAQNINWSDKSPLPDSVSTAVGKGAKWLASVQGTKAEQYTVNAIGVGGAAGPSPSADAAGVPLYQSAQALEQLSRTEADRKKN